MQIFAGEVIGKASEEQLRRIQIRETILSHIDRERQLFHKGIKVLSLFFIDEVAKYKQYDAAGQAYNGIYADMFEEEYENIIGTMQRTLGDEAYMKYLGEITAHETHAGYFSIDKKGHMVNGEISAKEKTSDDIGAYDLIMKNKELLLDRDPKRSPVALHLLALGAARGLGQSERLSDMHAEAERQRRAQASGGSDAVSASASTRTASAWTQTFSAATCIL